MRDERIVTVHRGDYRPPDFLVESIALEFDLDAERTRVTSTMHVVRRAPDGGAPLVLDGEDLELQSIDVDGREVAAAACRRDGGLVIDGIGARAVVRLVTFVRPRENSGLMGLFVSNENFFTQCEAEGFRRITYFPDRPDVMSVYTVTLRADERRYPVLLSNGNPVARGRLRDGRHFVRWHDPHPKPCYLFALVAGRFEANQARLRTLSGREVLLQIWVAAGQIELTRHAMASLQRAILWDEARFGRVPDLDRFMIVASDDFNLGAMENKGLNIFNARYVLASPEVATDDDFAGVEAIVGHEYFHNWTGNRVTCRDWFQLSLKEGLTVFREQEFVADCLPPGGQALRRIDDVITLRALQFPEDAGPLAHPVRPDSYQQISNFYTSTVYEKGAEVVRMLFTLLGRDGFRRGLDLYFERHDGHAVTCDEFVDAMASANDFDATLFRRWYAQAGTPRVQVTDAFDAATGTYTLNLTQNVPPTPGQADKQPVHIPFAVGLIGPDGGDLPLQLDGKACAPLLELKQRSESFRFTGIGERPVPSLARGFSAPVIVEYPYSEEDLAFLARHDSDPFNRWEAAQRLICTHLLRLVDDAEAGRALALAAGLRDLFAQPLATDPGYQARILHLPTEMHLAEQRGIAEPDAIAAARQFARKQLGADLREHWSDLYARLTDNQPYQADAASAGRRALRNLALGLLVDGGDADALRLARSQLELADNLTDRLAALIAIVGAEAPFKEEVLERCARRWRAEPLLMNKWFNVQATTSGRFGDRPLLARVRELLNHRSFALRNPNNVYALVLGFCAHNPREFHRADGSGYDFWVEQVTRLDRINPTVAARIARALDRWRKYTTDRARRMREALLQVAGTKGLSRDVHEIVARLLSD